MRYVKRILLSTIFGIIIVAALILTVDLHRPSTAKNIVSPVSQQPTQPKMIIIHSAYASFTYPNNMTPEVQQATPNASGLATFTFMKKDLVDWDLVITINRLSSSNLTSDAGYNLRKGDPSVYAPSTITTGSNTFAVMTDMTAADFSEVAFSVHGDMSADISLQGADATDENILPTTFREILDSWKWQ